MCERPGFWRWLVQGLVGAVRGTSRGLIWVIRTVPRAVPGLVRAIRKLNIREAIRRNPFYEFYTGMLGLVVVVSSIPEVSGLILAPLSLFSFLLVMHGLYRAEGDC